jgi:phospholipase/carboxylesterase
MGVIIQPKLNLVTCMDKPKLAANVDPLLWVGPDDPAFEYSGLVHYAHVPKEASLARPAPLVVMIHGWGGNEGVMWIFKQVIPPGVAVIAPRALFTLEEAEGFTWFHEQDGQRLEPIQDSLENALEKLQHFLASLPDLYPIDPKQLLLMGFSQGAAMITTLLLTQPQLKNQILGVALLAGAQLNRPQLKPPANLLAGLPVFIAHGSEDAIIPLAMAQQVRDTYLDLGAEVTYREYPTGHKVNSQGMKDLTAWLATRLSS